MGKLLMAYERDMPTVSITDLSFKQISQIRSIRYERKPLTDLTPRDIDETDLLFLVRPNDFLSWQIAKQARKTGCKVVTFLDDDLLNLPRDNPSIPWRSKALKKTLQYSDIICSSSKRILSRYCSMTAGGRVSHIDTIVQEKEIDAASAILDRPANETVTRIVYAASAGHVSLFNKYVLPIMPALAERFKGKISFTFISVRPELSAYEDVFPIQYLKGMPLAEYRQFMHENHFDIGLSPLNDDEFSRCKYFNKFLEYSLQGTVGVYSNVEPYTFVVRDGFNGFLADADPEAWLEKLSTAINDSGLRKKCCKNAIELLEERFTREKIAERLTQEIPELISGTRKTKKCGSLFWGKLGYYLLRPADTLYLVFFYLKNRGLSGFIEKIRTHMRERGAYKRK